VAELVDASDLKSDDLKNRVGSSPSRGTLESKNTLYYTNRGVAQMARVRALGA
jgi:hypothetical protein